MLSQITGRRLSTVDRVSMVWVVITIDMTLGPEEQPNRPLLTKKSRLAVRHRTKCTHTAQISSLFLPVMPAVLFSRYDYKGYFFQFSKQFRQMKLTNLYAKNWGSEKRAFKWHRMGVASIQLTKMWQRCQADTGHLSNKKSRKLKWISISLSHFMRK